MLNCTPYLSKTGTFEMALVIKILPANAGDVRDVGSIPGSERSFGGMATCSSILAWRIPWTEEPGGLPSTGSEIIYLNNKK